jgi:hypothetical protein
MAERMVFLGFGKWARAAKIYVLEKTAKPGEPGQLF